MTCLDFDDAHRAKGDVNATLAILLHDMFWEKRKEVCKGIQGAVHLGNNNTPTSLPPVLEGDSEDDEVSEESEDEVPAAVLDANDAEIDGQRMNTDL